MLPIDFEGTNIELGKPADMTDEQCSSVRAYKGIENKIYKLTLINTLKNIS